MLVSFESVRNIGVSYSGSMLALGASGLGSIPSTPNMKKEKCKLYILRHGETEWNKKGRVQGHLDSPLTEDGIKQAVKISQVLKEIPFSAIYSSDLPRAFKTAHIVKGERDFVIIPSKHLRECFYGPFQGFSYTAFKAATEKSRKIRGGLLEEEQWRYSLNGVVENDHDLVSRFMAELHRIAKNHKGEKVLVVTHGRCMRTMLMKLKVAPYGSLPAGTVKNCGYIVVYSDGFEFKIKHVDGLKVK